MNWNEMLVAIMSDVKRRLAEGSEPNTIRALYTIVVDQSITIAIEEASED